ncbi:MAG TPA: hypothetical protein VM389_07685 [Phycisphaerae bacterium]|nr:hypothetical protein [Phycisphaerae bacterium]
MANASDEIKHGLSLVRGRLRQLGTVKGLLLGLTVAGGALLVLMLADYVYGFGELTRVLLLAASALAVASVAGWHLLRVPTHPPKDGDVALYIEKRRPELQGSLLAAVEFGLAPGGGSAIRRYIVDVVMEEASRRLHLADLRRLIRLGRIRKQAFVCLVVLLLLGGNAAFFRSYFARQSRRVLTPWIAPPASDLDGLSLRERARRETFLTDDLTAPLRFLISPGNVEVPEGERIEVTAALSRSPLDRPVMLCYRSQEGAFQELPMRSVQRVYEYARALEDITKPIEYYVQVGKATSDHHFITVQQRLRVEGFELTYNYPDYLQRPSRKVEARVGDISAVEGSKVTVRIKTNHPPAAGRLTLTAGGKIPMTVGPKGAVAVVPVTANDTYHYVLRDERGKEVRSDTMFFIEAVPDNPPGLEIVGPNIDLIVHPISELTVTAKVTEDQALADVRLRYEVLRHTADGQVKKESRTKSFMPKGWSGAIAEAQAINVLELEGLQPGLQEDDTILYHVEVEDRKGQKAVSDMYSVVVQDFSLCAFYPDMHHDADEIVIAPLMKFIAAAWNLEQQRGKIPQEQFLARSKAIAEKMKHPRTGKVINFLSETGDATGVDRDPLTKEAYEHTVKAHGLLDAGEPGKAVTELKIVWGISMRFRKKKPKVSYSGSVAQMYNTIPLAEPSMGIAKILAHMNAADPDNMPPPPEPSDAIIVDVEYARKLGRKDVEKIAKVRKDIQKLRRQVQQIEEDPSGRPERPTVGRTGEEDSDALSNQRRRGQAGGEQDPQDQQGQPTVARPDAGQAGGDANQPGGDANQPGGNMNRPGQPGDGRQKPGERPRPQKPGAGEPGGNRPERMTQRAREAANEAEDLADRLHGQLAARDNKDIRRGLNDLRSAAARLQRATREFSRRQVGAGLSETREAGRLLGNADQALAGAEQGTLNEMVARATRQAYRLSDHQVRVRTAIGELRKHDRQYREAVRTGRRNVVAQERARREGVVAALQTLGKEAQGFSRQLGQTQEAAKQARATAVGQFVGQAGRIMDRQDLPQDMVDSALDIRRGNLASAGKAQEGAGRAIQQALEALNNATDVLSGTRSGALERANRIAQKVKKQAKALLARADAGPGRQPNQRGRGTGRPRGGPATRPGEGPETRPGQRGGPETRPGEGPERPGQRGGPETRPGEGPDRRGRGEDGNRPRRPEQGGAPSGREGMVAHSTDDRDAGRLWGDVRVLVRQLRTLDVVPRNAVDILDRTSQSQERFRKMFSRLRKQDVVAFVGVVSEIADRVASDLERAKAEKRLQTGLREECPPVYRRLVGMYYKALSGGK